MSLIIGIGGGSGSGKSTLAKLLKEKYGNDLSILNYDRYCLGADELPECEKHKKNYDVPSSYDASLFTQHVEMLREDKPIESPIFDFSIHSRIKQTETLYPNKIIILEGILVYQVTDVLKNIDIKIYVDASDELRLRRRTRRDIVERGRTAQSVYEQFHNTVLPMHHLYIEPTKEICDYVLNNEQDTGIDLKQFEEIVKIIDNKLNA